MDLHSLLKPSYVIRIYCGLAAEGLSDEATYSRSYDIVMEVADYWFGDGCTVYSAKGIWHAIEEDTMIIEYMVPKEELAGAYNVAVQCAQEYKRLNFQETVLVTIEKNFIQKI